MPDKESNGMFDYNEATTSDEATDNKPDVSNTFDIGNNSNYVKGVSDEVIERLMGTNKMIYVFDIDSSFSKKVLSNYSCVEYANYTKYTIDSRDVYCFSTAVVFFGAIVAFEEDEKFFKWLKRQVYKSIAK